MGRMEYMSENLRESIAVYPSTETVGEVSVNSYIIGNIPDITIPIENAANEQLRTLAHGDLSVERRYIEPAKQPAAYDGDNNELHIYEALPETIEAELRKRNWRLGEVVISPNGSKLQFEPELEDVSE